MENKLNAMSLKKQFEFTTCSEYFINGLIHREMIVLLLPVIIFNAVHSGGDNVNITETSRVPHNVTRTKGYERHLRRQEC